MVISDWKKTLWLLWFIQKYFSAIRIKIIMHMRMYAENIVASELKDPIWHSSEWQIGSFSFEATIWTINKSHVLSLDTVYVCTRSKLFWFPSLVRVLTLSSLNLPLPSSSTTSRELLSQFSTCSGWRWLEVGGKWKNILLFLKRLRENFRPKTTGFQEIKSFFRDLKWCFNASWGFKGLKQTVTQQHHV